MDEVSEAPGFYRLVFPYHAKILRSKTRINAVR